MTTHTTPEGWKSHRPECVCTTCEDKRSHNAADVKSKTTKSRIWDALSPFAFIMGCVLTGAFILAFLMPFTLYCMRKWEVYLGL